MPIGFCTTMCTMKKIRLFLAAFQNGFDQSGVGQQRDEIARSRRNDRRRCCRSCRSRGPSWRSADRSRTACRSRPRARETAPAAPRNRASRHRGDDLGHRFGHRSFRCAVSLDLAGRSRVSRAKRERGRPFSRLRETVRASAPDEGAASAHFAGSYHLSRPSCSCLPAASGRQRAVDDLRRDVPEFVLEVRRAARQDLVGVADRRLAVLAPADHLGRQRILDRDRRLAQREEARQRVGVEFREFRRRQPFEELLGVRPCSSTPRSRPCRCRCGRRCSSSCRRRAAAAGRRRSGTARPCGRS